MRRLRLGSLALREKSTSKVYSKCQRCRESVFGVRDPRLEPAHDLVKEDALTVHITRAERLLQAGLTDDLAQWHGHILARPELPASAEHPSWKGHLHSSFVAVFRSIRTEENAVFLILSGVRGALALPTGLRA